MAPRRTTPRDGGDIMDVTRTRSRRRLLRIFGALTGLVTLAVTDVGAQMGDGFLFRPPIGSITVRGGYQAPAIRSDIFSFAGDLLTLDRQKLSGAAWGADLGGSFNDRWEFLLSVDWFTRSAETEYRRFDELLSSGQRRPITQRNDFRRLPVTVGLRYNLRPAGERIGQFAWLPNRVVPFLVGGVGGSFHRFRQVGDFIDFNRGNSIFYDEYESSGWGLIGYGGAGLDVSLSSIVSLSTQLRAVVGNSSMGPDFRGFQPIDLSGLVLTTGIRLRTP